MQYQESTFPEPRIYRSSNSPDNKVPEQIPGSRYSQEDNTSTASVYYDSAFLVGSLETPATESSQDNRFSAAQILSATRVFVSILEEDEVLAPLYRSARNNPFIGPKVLRRTLRGLIQRFANDLEGEATDHLGFSASKLVRAKAHHAARYIASKENTQQPWQSPANQQSSGTTTPDDSSDDEVQNRLVVEKEFDDLHTLRLYLTESGALKSLREKVRAFCFPESILLPAIEAVPRINSAVVPGKSRTRIWQDEAIRLIDSILLGSDATLMVTMTAFLILDAVFLLTDSVFIAARYLETPLERGWSRIRGKCVSSPLNSRYEVQPSDIYCRNVATSSSMIFWSKTGTA
jgi:hypothetical protein